MIRNFHPTDVSYVVDSHAKIYGDEYNFDASFRDYIVETTHRFTLNFDVTMENLWIMEHDGREVGSIAIVKLDKC